MPSFDRLPMLIDPSSLGIQGSVSPPSPLPSPDQGQGGSDASKGSSPLGHTSLLDSVVFALTGTPTSMLTPEQQRARAGRRRDASKEAVNELNDPGEQYMNAPTTGGSGVGLGDIIKLVSALGGAGGGG